MRENEIVFRLLHLVLQQPFKFVFFMFPGLKMGNIISFEEEKTILQMQE